MDAGQLGPTLVEMVATAAEVVATVIGVHAIQRWEREHIRRELREHRRATEAGPTPDPDGDD